MTKCHSVPTEGSTTQCDAGPEGSEAEGVDEIGKLSTPNERESKSCE